jgi:hypothetical protein
MINFRRPVLFTSPYQFAHPRSAQYRRAREKQIPILLMQARSRFPLSYCPVSLFVEIFGGFAPSIWMTAESSWLL